MKSKTDKHATKKFDNFSIHLFSSSNSNKYSLYLNIDKISFRIDEFNNDGTSEATAILEQIIDSKSYYEKSFIFLSSMIHVINDACQFSIDNIIHEESLINAATEMYFNDKEAFLKYNNINIEEEGYDLLDYIKH